jgi:hypothetical protein
VAGFGCIADDFVEHLVSLYGNLGKPFSSKKKSSKKSETVARIMHPPFITSCGWRSYQKNSRPKINCNLIKKIV